MERKDAAHNWGERLWKRNVCSVRYMRFAVDHVIMNFRVKGRFDLRCRAGKLDPLTSARYRGDCEIVLPEPGSDLLQVTLCSCKLGRILLGGEPLLIIWRLLDRAGCR